MVETRVWLALLGLQNSIYSVSLALGKILLAGYDTKNVEYLATLASRFCEVLARFFFWLVLYRSEVNWAPARGKFSHQRTHMGAFQSLFYHFLLTISVWVLFYIISWKRYTNCCKWEQSLLNHNPRIILIFASYFCFFHNLQNLSMFTSKYEMSMVKCRMNKTNIP